MVKRDMKNKVLVASAVLLAIAAILVFVWNNRWSLSQGEDLGPGPGCYFRSDYAVAAKLMDYHGVRWSPEGHSCRISGITSELGGEEYVPEDVLIVDIHEDKCVIVVGISQSGASGGRVSTYATGVPLSQLSYDEAELGRARHMNSNCHIIMYYYGDYVQSEYLSPDYNLDKEDFSPAPKVMNGAYINLYTILIINGILALALVALRLFKKSVVWAAVPMIAYNALLIVWVMF